MWWIGHLVGGLAGAIVIFVVLLAVAGYMYLRSRRTPVDHRNVNDEWGAAPVGDQRVPAGTSS
jgi:PiT family inorganic phosphate transporter